MARIKADDVAAVKERAHIEDIVREHVTLRSAGPGSLKGLCPFHDEKTPSFNVRPAAGAYHCFGCGEGGDVISFVMKVDHLTFAEAVERLAGKLGMELRYEDGDAPRDREPAGRRARLVEAHRAAAEFYLDVLLTAQEARAGRDFLRAKGFDGEASRHFGVGFAPRSGEALAKHLRSKGFTAEELLTGGLVGQGSRGVYDRFRGRVVWPIRDVTGDTVGFGARRIFDDDRVQAKYLNTAETPIYKKATVLYGLDLAKKAMARDRTAVVVEGYTDVMACHLAGVDQAVATCGTAFGLEHIRTLRRIIRDEAGSDPARVVFTFDGDAAGQKAALRAFSDDDRWASQSYIAVAPHGQDPNEVRQSKGDDAVRHLVQDAVPMFQFAARTTMDKYDLRTPEGRVGAIRGVAPILAGLRDETLRDEYERTTAGWIGVGLDQVQREVLAAAHRKANEPSRERHTEPEPSHEDDTLAGLPAPDLRDPSTSTEHQLLQILVQHPSLVDAEAVDAIPLDAFGAVVHQLVWSAIGAAGGVAAAAGMSSQGWTRTLTDLADPRVRGTVTTLAVEPVPARLDPQTGRPPQRYADALLERVEMGWLQRRIDEAMGEITRAGSADEATRHELGTRLQELQRRQAYLRSKGAS